MLLYFKGHSLHVFIELIWSTRLYKFIDMPRYALPAVLFTNRAQCYISLKKWKEAIEDCTQAIIRSYEGVWSVPCFILFFYFIDNYVCSNDKTYNNSYK